MDSKKIMLNDCSMGEDEIYAVSQVLKSGQLTKGPKVEEFEKCFAKYLGVKYAIAVSNGTVALHCILRALDIGHGDEVIVPAMTFIATANAVLSVDAKPVFADINMYDYNISLASIKEKITSRTKAIIAVDLYGLPYNFYNLVDAIPKRIKIIEDACQSAGAGFWGAKCGTLGIASAFSLFATKPIAVGEGGVVTTDNKKIADYIRLYRNQGREGEFTFNTFGWNCRLTDMQAAIAFEQLNKLDFYNDKRIEHADYLKEKLDDVKGIVLPKDTLWYMRKHVYHQFVIRVTKDYKMTRNELLKKLNDNGVQALVHYPVAVHKTPFYQSFVRYRDVRCPNAERLAREAISLPVHPRLTKENLDKIIRLIK